MEATSYPLLRETKEKLQSFFDLVSNHERLEPQAIVLYGAGMYADSAPPRQPISVLIVVGRVSGEVLSAVRECWKAPRRWPVETPLVLGREEIEKSRDTFPVEFLQIRSTGVLVHGELDFACFDADLSDLRLQCERELRGLLLHSRLAYLQFSGKERNAGDWMKAGVPKLTSLVRSLAVLAGESPAGSPEKVLSRYTQKQDGDSRILEDLRGLLSEKRPSWSHEQMFRLMSWLRVAVEQVDAWQNDKGRNGDVNE